MNLELPWAHTPLGFDSQDSRLDVVALTDADGTWSVRYKDEDELAFYTDLGLISERMRSVIVRAGKEATEAALARDFPFNADWSEWIPNPAWAAADLPPEWSVLQ